jgi:hypothetical protein
MPKSQPSAAAILWSRRIEHFQQSGLSGAAFCKAQGFSLAAFYRWKQKLGSKMANHSADSTSPPPMKFLPVALFNDDYRRSPLLDHQVIRPTAQRPVAAMTIDLPGGISIRVELPVGERQTP